MMPVQRTVTPKYPLRRLQQRCVNYEERVLVGRERLDELQCRRRLFEKQLEELQLEDSAIRDRISLARRGEALVREKERQIAEEFSRLVDTRRHHDSGVLLKRTLEIGRELFDLLLKDMEIERTARTAFGESLEGLGTELRHRAAERDALQDRVIGLRRECEADLEQKRCVYDENKDLERRSEALDAEIGMLMEWKNSLETQITAVRAALDKKKDAHAHTHLFARVAHNVRSLSPRSFQDDVESLYSEKENANYEVVMEKGKQCIEATSDPMLELPAAQTIQHSDKPLGSITPEIVNPDSRRKNASSDHLLPCGKDHEELPVEAYFASSSSSSNIKLPIISSSTSTSTASCTSDATLASSLSSCSVKDTSSHTDAENASVGSANSFMTIRSSRSSIQSASGESEEETPPFDQIIDKLEAVRNMRLPSSTESVHLAPPGVEYWREVMPQEIINTTANRENNSEEDDDEEDISEEETDSQ